MNPPRAGSRKASVYDCFIASGADAAITLGATLDLASGTVKSWLGGWAKAAGNPEAAKSSPRAKGEAPAPRDDIRKVFDVGYPDRLGVVIKEGEQVSEVRWDPGHPGFTSSFVSNKYLRFKKRKENV